MTGPIIWIIAALLVVTGSVALIMLRRRVRARSASMADPVVIDEVHDLADDERGGVPTTEDRTEEELQAHLDALLARGATPVLALIAVDAPDSLDAVSVTYKRADQMLGPGADPVMVAPLDGHVLVLLGGEPGSDVARAIHRIETFVAAAQDDGGEVMRAGIAVAPHDGSQATQLVHAAAVAMYSGRRPSATHVDHRQDLGVRERLRADPRRPDLGIAVGDLQVAFQPKVSFSDLQLVGAEALIRWPAGHRSPLPAAEIIARAEAHGLITDLTDHVLERSASLITRLRAEQDFQVSINVATDDLADPDLPLRMSSYLDRHDLPAESITIEVTENILLTSGVESVGTLPTLKELGVQISLDDFGTGYSSLSHVRRFPVDEIKIDMSFVDRVAFQDMDRVIAGTIVHLARGLGIGVVAEGVESAEAWALLAGFGVDVAQGHNVCRALDEDAFLAWLEMWRNDGQRRPSQTLPPAA